MNSHRRPVRPDHERMPDRSDCEPARRLAGVEHHMKQAHLTRLLNTWRRQYQRMTGSASDRNRITVFANILKVSDRRSTLNATHVRT